MSKLQEARKELLDYVESLSAEARQRRPEGGWSALDNLEHLYLMERVITGIIRQGLEAAPQEPVAELDLYQAVQIRSRKAQAPDFVCPKGLFDSLETAKGYLADAREELLQLVTSIQDRDALNVRSAPHPALGTMSLKQWYDVISYHDLRHLEQIKETAAALGA